MRLPIPALLASWQFVHPDTGHQRRDLSPRAVVNVGPDGATCPAIPTTTVEYQPVFYSEYLPYNTIIDPFRNGHPLQVTNAPTTVVTAGYLTRTIDPGPGSGGSNPTNPSNPDNGSNPTNPSNPDNGSNPTNPNNSNPNNGNSNAPTGPNNTNGGASTTIPTQSGANASPTFTPGPGNNGIQSEMIPPVDSQISMQPPPSGPNPIGSDSIISTRSAGMSGSNGTTMSNTVAANATATGSGSVSSGMMPSGNNSLPNGSGTRTDMNMGSTSDGAGMTMSGNSANTGGPSGDTMPGNAATSSSGNNPSASPLPTPLAVPFALGQGVAGGSLTDLPASQFLFLAFTRDAANPGVKRNVRRQQNGPSVTGTASVSEAALVDLAPASATPSGSGSGGSAVTPDRCDSATPFNLANGTLSGANFTLSKEFGTTEALFGSVEDPSAAIVNVTFSLVDGILSWITPDRGVADFFLCFGNNIYVSFPGDAETGGFEGCDSITVGAIAGDLCRAFVAQTRTPRADFVAPLATDASTNGTAGSSSATGSTNPVTTPLGDSSSSNGPIINQPGSGSSTVSPNLPNGSGGPATPSPGASNANAGTSSGALPGTLPGSQNTLPGTLPGTLPSGQPSILPSGTLPGSLPGDLPGTAGTPGASGTLPQTPQGSFPGTLPGTLPSTPSVPLSPPTGSPSAGPLTQLPAACQALNALAGSSIVPQLALCRTSLGLLATTNTRVATCLATNVGLTTRGADIALCLNLALGLSTGTPSQSPGSGGSGGSSFSLSLPTGPQVTLPSLSLTLPTPSVSLPSASAGVSLTAECRALTGLSGLALQTQLALCSASLGALATTNANVASCLTRPGASGTDIVQCLLNALAGLPGSGASSTGTGGIEPPFTPVSSSGLPLPTGLPNLPAACRALEGLRSLTVLAQLNLCTAALGPLALDANVANCLAVTITESTIGSDIVLCLTDALLRLSQASSTLPGLTTPTGTGTTNIPLPIPSLPAACSALNGLSGLGVAGQLALCTTSLGDLATRADVASCVGVTVGANTLGSNIVICLDAALGITVPGTTTIPPVGTPPLSSLLPSVSPVSLTQACQALQSLTGLAVSPQLALCATSLGNLATQAGVASCLGVTVGVNTPGSDIVVCLDAALGINVGNPGSTTTRPLGTPSISLLPTATSINLTPACDALASLTGLAVSPQLALCTISLGSLADLPSVVSCLAVTVGLNTNGIDIVTCLENAFSAPTSAATFTPATPLTPRTPNPSATALPNLLPAACEALVGINGLPVAAQISLCATALGSLALRPAVASCLNAGVNVNTVGANVALCLTAALEDNTSISAPSSLTSIPLPTATPLTALTPACQALTGLTGTAVVTQASLCTISLGNLASLPQVSLCLQAVTTNTIGANVVACLDTALGISTASVSVSLPSQTSATLPTNVPGGLTSACAAIENLAGLLITPQLQLCTTSLGSLALDPDVAACLATTVVAGTRGSDIVDCLVDALANVNLPSTSVLRSTTSLTNIVLPTPSLPVLSAACDALANVNGLSVSAQLSQCTASLGSLALRPEIASCLSVTVSASTIGGDILDCLIDALDAEALSSSLLGITPTSTSLALPTPSLPSLTAECDSLENTNGLQVTAQLALCATSLGSLALQPDVASCLSVTVGASTVGGDILDCLVDAVLSPATTSAGLGGSTPTQSLSLPPLPSCLNDLPLACDALDNLVGSTVTVQLGLCSAVLAPVVLTNAAASACLNTNVQLNTQGADIVACLETALLCPGQTPSSRATPSTTRTSSTTASPSALCLNVLPASCENLASQSGLSLLSGLGTCQLELPLSIEASASVCLSVDISNLVNGQSIVDCLRATVLCPGVTASTTRRTAASTTAAATATATPGCLTQLPATCNALNSLTGFALNLPVVTCLADITPLVAGQTLAGVTTCLSTAAILPTTPGSDIVRCLTAAALCPATTASTSALSITANTIASSATTSPSPSIVAPPLPDCLNILPTVCSTITGTGLAALLAPVQACSLALLPELNVAGQVAAGACLATNAILATTTGADVQACLNAAIVCSSTTGSTPTATTLRNVSTTSSRPSASPTAALLSNCITTLPSVCQTVNQSNGLALIGPLGLCQAALLPELTIAGTAKALLCLDTTTLVAVPATQGSARLTCLNNNVICGGSNALSL